MQKHGNGLVDFLYIRFVIFNSTFDQNLTSSKGPAYETVFRELKCATFHPDCSFKPLWPRWILWMGMFVC